jgi:predicted glycoside hydrolase/deacetylase ChbG (UPF0249 family)
MRQKSYALAMVAPRRLIIHADDLGLSPAVTRGILTGMAEGMVSSTSLLCNFPESRPALAAAAQAGRDVGWHLNLVQGRPLCPPEKIPSLIDREGNFFTLGRLVFHALGGRLVPGEIRLELETQYQVFSEAGIRPSHLDGHLHTHLLPGIREVVKTLVREKSIPFLRIPRETGGLHAPRWVARTFINPLRASRPEFWQGSGAEILPFFGLALSGRPGQLKLWEQELAHNPHPIAECMVHPGYYDPKEMPWLGKMGKSREAELDWLTSPTLRKLLRDLQYELISFADLKKNSKKN